MPGSGIPDDGVIYTFYSNDKLWLALQNGISVIDILTPVAFLNQTSGLKGSISDVKTFNNKPICCFYCRSHFYRFTKTTINPTTFVRFRILFKKAGSFLKHKNKILTALTDGFYQVDGLSLTKLGSKWTGCYSIYSSSFFPAESM
ncbi:MAG: hypothetical protein IPI19_11950 [Ignavibacteriales bacterium]|nr:hypothetical protein [Ignavibacteriales bacterium]